MLHKYERIDEAMAACVTLEYPLAVIVHGKLPENVNNADEAARGGQGGGSGGAAAATYSFLPPSYGASSSNTFNGVNINGSSSLFADDNNVLFESTLTAPSHDAANANAALGLLMRPANLSATADRAAVAAAVDSGEELTLVRDFPLGSLQGGAAQREALLISLLESRLGSVTLLHLIEEGTPAYESFAAAVPVPGAATGADASPVLPRVHIFYAPTVGLAPMVLHGATLTPQNVHNCVQMGLLRPRTRSDASNSGSNEHNTGNPAAAAASGLRTFFTASVTSMNAEFERSRQIGGGSGTAPPPQPASPPHPQQQQSARSGVAVMSSPAVRATGVSRSDALAAAHLISVAGLPTCFSTAPIPGSPSSNNSGASAAASSHKTILTTPAMTMQTVWRVVEKHLEWAQHEVQQAQAASVWNGVTPPKPGAKFTLTITGGGSAEDKTSASSTGGSLSVDGKAVVVVHTPAEAAQVRLQDFPRNTVVHVDFEGWAPARDGFAAATQQQQQQEQQQQSHAPFKAAPAASSGAEYVCEGDVCRRVTRDEAPSASASASAPAPSKESAASSPASSATAAAPATSIKLHCSLPNGKTLDVDQLDPSTDTLQAKVRPAVEAALGYSNFLFVCAYPPKRYSVEVDEPRLLQEIGLARSSALRVVALDGTGSPNAASAPGLQQQQQQQPQQAGATRQMLSSAASSLMGLFGGRNNAQGGAAPSGNNSTTKTSNKSSPSASASGAPRRTYNSMAEMLAANEAAERETAMERLRQEQQQQQAARPFMGQDPADAEQQQQRNQGKKSNRYFGGGSTEYIAEDNNSRSNNNHRSDDGGSAAAATDGMTQEEQSAFLREQLQRLMQQARGQGTGGEGQEGEDEEEEFEGEGHNGGAGGTQQRGGHAAERHRAFQGQGRRLAGDDAAPTGQSAPAPPAPDASGAKKNQ